jgi:hypothetical protein
MLSMNASSLKGITMPLTPMMLMPPSMPRRGLKVRLAMVSPWGALIVILRLRVES